MASEMKIDQAQFDQLRELLEAVDGHTNEVASTSNASPSSRQGHGRGEGGRGGGDQLHPTAEASAPLCRDGHGGNEETCEESDPERRTLAHVARLPLRRSTEVPATDQVKAA